MEATIRFDFPLDLPGLSFPGVPWPETVQARGRRERGEIPGGGPRKWPATRLYPHPPMDGMARTQVSTHVVTHRLEISSNLFRHVLLLAVP